MKQSLFNVQGENRNDDRPEESNPHGKLTHVGYMVNLGPKGSITNKVVFQGLKINFLNN